MSVQINTDIDNICGAISFILCNIASIALLNNITNLIIPLVILSCSIMLFGPTIVLISYNYVRRIICQFQ
jgi:hypothetical protein